MPHETSSIFTLERPFRGARQRLRLKLGRLDRSTRLSVDGLLGVLASSNESHRLACRAHAGCSLHARDESSENPITDLRKASAADETTTPITIDAQGAACNATECVALEAVPHPVSFLVIVIGPYLQYSVLYIPLV